MPTLSVCLIVRNEARHLPRCLASIQALADEIVVVDTGSTDATVAIAQAHGARVSHYAWHDDFSAAKNASIEHATGDWILSIDADETIAPRDHQQIRALLLRTDVDAVVVPQRHYLAGDTTLIGWQPGDGGYAEGEPFAGFVDVDCRRLFRNQPRLRFRNRVHEALVSLDPARPLIEMRGHWVIHHFGKLGGRELLRAKGEAYLRIGKKKVEEEPRNPQAHYELGVQYAELLQPQAAIACFSRALELAGGFRDAQLRIALCYIDQKEYRKALTALRRSARALPQHAADIALAEGNVHRELGDAGAAEHAFRKALAASPGLAAANFNLALLYRRQGRFDDALACADAALAHAPAHAELRLLRGRLRADRGDDGGALDDLATLSDARALHLRARILIRQRRFADARLAIAPLDGIGDADLLSLRGAVALGLGETGVAVDQLRAALEARPTTETALNLATALEARGDRDAALVSAAEALRLTPAHPSAVERVARLAGNTFATRASVSDRLTFVFCQPHSIPFDGTTPRTRGLGGTESAIVYLAEALARRGHRAIVLNNCESAGNLRDVEYGRWETLVARCIDERPDVVVGVRFWDTIGRLRLAPLQILWTGDAFDQPFVEHLSDRNARGQIDLFMLQSSWQIDTFHRAHDIPLSQIVRTPLGTAASAATPPLCRRQGPRARRLAYASTPFRGLDVLLDLFPHVRRECRDAELDVYSSMRVYGVDADQDQRQFDVVYRKARQPGVHLIGSVPQPELAERLQQARILAYPNHYPETFCIAAAEAQAAGCVVITSQEGALPETVGDGGICLPGDPRSSGFREAFVAACVGLLTDDGRWTAMSERASAQAWERYTWASVAGHWESVCAAALSQEPTEVSRVAVHLAAGRAGLAHRMLSRTPKPGPVPDGIWEELHHVTAWRAGEAAAPSMDALRRIGLYFPSLRRSGVLDSSR